MNTETEMIDFDVLISSVDGSEVVDTVKIQVPITRDPQTGEELLTPEAHEKIE